MKKIKYLNDMEESNSSPFSLIADFDGNEELLSNIPASNPTLSACGAFRYTLVPLETVPSYPPLLVIA